MLHENSGRIKWLDFAKGLMIFLVIFIHVADNLHLPYVLLLLKDTALIIVMPVFFAISGYLYKSVKNIHSYLILIYKKVTSFIIPYYIFTIICLLLHMNNGASFYKFLYLPLNYLWFLYALFFIFIIFGFLDLIKCPDIIKFLISLILMSISSILLPHIIVSNSFNASIYNSIAGISGYMIIFYLGYFIKIHHLISFFKKHLVSLLVSFILLTIAYFIIKGVKLNTDFITKSDVILKLISVPVFFSIFCNIHNNLLFKYFTKYGKFTLMIYLFQSPIIIILDQLFLTYSYRFLQNYSLLVFCILVVLSWCLCIIISKWIYSNDILYTIFYPRLFINKLMKKTKIGKKFLNN